MKTETTEKKTAFGTETAKTVAVDNPNSIEVSQNAKGQYSFSVKMYFDNDEHGQAIGKIFEAYAALHDSFKNPKE